MNKRHLVHLWHQIPCVSWLTILLVTLMALPIGAATRYEDFEDGSLFPFSTEGEETHDSVILTPPFGARAGSKAHKLKWFESKYDGSRGTRGVEGMSARNSNPRITSEGWYAFSFYLPAGEFPTNKRTIMAQIIAWHSSLPATNKSIVVSMGSDGALGLNAYYGTGDGDALSTGSIKLWTSSAGKMDTWHDLIIYVKFSNNNTGEVKAWLNGAPEGSPTGALSGIKVGNGAWTSANLMTIGAYVKWGMYCWDTANYSANETRTIYFDEIAYQVGNPAGSFNAVKPAGGTSAPSDTVPPTVPNGLSAKVLTSSSVALAWNPSTDDVGVAGYDVYHNGTNMVSVDTTTVLMSDLTPGTSSFFTIRARDAAGNVSASSAALAVTPQDYTSGLTRLAIASVVASAAEAGNPPDQSIDGDLDTRWSAQGIPQTVTYTLAQPATLELLRIALYLGDQRKANFDIHVSSNGQDWTTIGSGPSSGLTSALEFFDLGSHANVGWVRYVGKGNTVNDWNSLLEVELWGTVADSSPAVTYAVTYHANGATSGTAPSGQTKTHDTALTLATNSGNLARTGFHFAGWNTAANGSGTNYATAARYAVNAGVTLYAKWTAVTYAVTYHANGATSGTVPPAQSKTHGVALTLATNSGNLTQTGFTFTGWNTAAHGSGTSYPVGASYSANTELMVYALWSAQSAGPGSPAPAPDSSVDAPKASSCGVGTAFGLVLFIAGLCFRYVRPRF